MTNLFMGTTMWNTTALRSRSSRSILVIAYALFLCVLLLFSFAPREAMAFPCADAYTSLEERFISAPLVFTGVAHPDQMSPNGTPFTVTRIYKSPWKDAASVQNIFINRPDKYGRLSSERPSFSAGGEYLLFAAIDMREGSTIVGYTGVCGSRLTADGFLARLRDSTSSRTAAGPAITFTGRVIRSYQWSDDAAQKPTISAVVQFEVGEVFRGGDTIKRRGTSAVPRHLSAYLKTCGDAYQINQHYLVEAGALSQPPLTVELPRQFDSPAYFVQCGINREAINLAEKSILERLSHQHN